MDPLHPKTSPTYVVYQIVVPAATDVCLARPLRKMPAPPGQDRALRAIARQRANPGTPGGHRENRRLVLLLQNDG